MASPAFRSASVDTGVGSTRIPAEPTGTLQDDILVAVAYIESASATFVAPAGWSSTFDGGSVDSGVMTTPDTWEAHAYWIRRGASAPSYTFEFTASAYGEVRVVAYSGAYASGDPFSFASLATRNTAVLNSPFPDVSGTTDTADELLLWFGANFVGGNATWPTSPAFTGRSTTGNDIHFGDFAQAVAGATGTVTGANPTTGTSNAASFLFGLRSLAAPSGGVIVPTHILNAHTPFAQGYQGRR
jgi:hypothetical protein